jgi:hypothetical protein
MTSEADARLARSPAAWPGRYYLDTPRRATQEGRMRR